MSEHYDFHYQPTGSGAISGQQVLEQTEDAINELGDYVNDNVGGAMDVAQQALETAQNAEQDAQTALDTANSFSSAIQSAQQDASTALSTAQTAQTTAIQAQQDASSAVTTANNASGQVNTLSGTVTALGQRVTTAEGNITTLQNDVTIAQGNASSAMATAGQVKQQAFVFRYSSTALVASSTNSNTLLDNTDNLKVGDKVIDSNGVLFSITAIDTANSTFTIGASLIDLAQDSDVVHKSGDENVNGIKTFKDMIPIDGDYLGNEASTNQRTNICLRSNRDTTDKSCAYITRFRQNRSQGALQTGDLQKIGFDVLENKVRTNNVFDIQCTDWLNDVPQKVNFVSSAQSYSFGYSTNKALINGLNPSSLGMPDLSNGIDISSYITRLDKGVNQYTPPANGWLSIRVKKTSLVHASLMIYQTGGLLSSCETDEFNISGTNLPVIANQNVEIYIYADALVEAKFFPCQGNV